MTAKNKPAGVPVARPAPAPPRQCSALANVKIIPRVFSPEECRELIRTAVGTWTRKSAALERVGGDAAARSGELGERLESDYRETTTYTPSPPPAWLLERLASTVVAANGAKDGWGFHLGGFAEPPSVLEYHEARLNASGQPGQFGWHIDIGAAATSSMRKLSYSVLLNPDEYEGGMFWVKISRDDRVVPGQDRIGTMILFPSYLLHSVSPVTKGTRYALVGWAHGNSFV